MKRMKGLSFYGYYIGMAFATLAKGPVGFILPLSATLIFLFVQKDWKGFKAMKLFPGILLFMAIVSAWYLPAILKGGKEYLDATLLHHSFDRFAKGSAHIRPIHYYFYNFPLDYLPWIIFSSRGYGLWFFQCDESKEKGIPFSDDLVHCDLCIFFPVQGEERTLSFTSLSRLYRSWSGNFGRILSLFL